jgi:translation initiation factor IF-2
MKDLLEFVHGIERGERFDLWQARWRGKFKLPCRNTREIVNNDCRCLSEISELRLASTTLRRHYFWQALSTNNIDMSSTESSGAPAEASATSPTPAVAASFGSTRGSGLARGKAKRPSAPADASAASAEYTPTAIAVVTAPREYQNPFAPVETPAAVTAEPVQIAAPVRVAPVTTYLAPAAVETTPPFEEEAAPAVESAEPAALNILEPAQQKVTPAQTWESEGFRPARESRGDRPRREESPVDERPERAPREAGAPFDPSTIPAKFLYVRPGYNYVPTPSNYGGAPRDRDRGNGAATPGPAMTQAAAPQKSGGFFGWLKSLFGSAPAEVPAQAEARPFEARSGGDRQRGGRGRGQGGGDGQRRRSRGGRGRSQSRGEYRSGGDQGGGPAN